MTDDRPIRAAENRRVRWTNGLGWTREIVRVPDRDDWDWRVSIAESDHPAPFSELPGIDRELLLLRGSRLALRFDDGEVRELRPFESARFAGERALTGVPIDGPTEQLNLMWRRERVAASELHPVSDESNRLQRLSIVLTATSDPSSLQHSDAEFIHMLEGEMDHGHGASTHRLGPGDSLQIDGEGVPGPMKLVRAPIRFLSVITPANRA